MKKITKISILGLLGFSLFSCEVGLGPAVDTHAPVINVTSPEMNSNVNGTMYIAGVATDDQELNEVTITIEENKIGGSIKNLKIVNKEWFVKENDEWIPFAGTVIGDKKSITWDASVDLSGAVSGSEYTITTQVTDLYNNDSRHSKDIRTVLVDYKTPIVSVSSPSLTNYATAETHSAKYKLNDNTILNQLLNGSFTISGTQDEDTKCDHLFVYLDTNKTTDLSMYENVDGTMNFNSRDADTTYLAYKKITDKNQRNWETTFNVQDFPLQYQTGKHLVRVVTESHDSANNIEYKCQGWFTLWNDADKPWIVAEFGGSSKENIQTVYPSCQLQGQAYDDDGLKSIDVEVFKDVDGNWIKLESNCFTIDLSKKDYPTYYAWSVASLTDNCSFCVKATCTDKNDIVSDSETRYMSVLDTNPPTLTVNQSGSGDSIPLTGTGDFTISGSISDDGEIAELKIVRIADGKESTEIKYFDKGYNQWSCATELGYVDINENKIWSIPMKDEVIINKLHKREFTKTFNIYRDFGINGTSQKLCTQKFIVMAKDKGGSATIELVAYGGDTEKPSVTIDTISINGGKERDLDGTIILEPFKSGDYVELSGTWKDNTDVLNKSNISLEWDKVSNIGITVTYDDATKTSGKWKSGKITPPSATTAVIYATIKDWGDNVGKTNASFYVSSSFPQFVRISADTADGSYKAGSEILLYMEFNKNVSFKNETPKNETPSLILNTGKIATYKSGNGTSKHIFSYTVEADDTAEKLTVTGLNKTGITWYDTEVTTSTIADSAMVLPTGNNTLEANRSITIDTTAPTLSGISAITSAGYYGLNSEIFISAKFNETVNFENLDDLKLVLNSGDNVKTYSVSKSGPDTVLFKYKVAEGHEANPLKVSAIDYGNCKVFDIAGNELTDKSISQLTTSINIDTKKPNTPIISNLINNSVIYDNAGVEFTIDYKESTGIKKYSLDGGKSWADYSGAIKLLNKGTYDVTAYQEDLAGNQSDEATTVKVTVDRGQIITSLTANKPDGTYKTGQKLSIMVTYRKEVLVSDESHLVLNTTPPRNAKYQSGSGTKKIYYEYEIQDGDSCSVEALTPKSFSGKITDLAGNNISAYTTIASVTKPNRFVDNKEIYVITKRPEITSVDFAGTEANRTLKIIFSSRINKNDGNIVITQSETGYKAPAVLSSAQYGDLPKAVQAYYSEGTNGSDSSGKSDVLKKYILNFNTNTDNATLTQLFINAGILTTSIPVYSNAVSIAGNVMTIDLSNTYKLPVKGASYTISIPENLINDDITQTNVPSSYTKTLPGVEKPLIRINKKNETISGTTVTQPLTADVKMDCQTPGAKIYYVDGSSQYSQRQLTSASDYTNGYANKGMPGTPAAPTTNSSLYSESFTIGSNDISKYNVGYKVFLRARATVNDTNWSEDSYETAYRTVIVFNQAPGTYNYMWIRGGDKTNGGVSVPNFPFSWNSSEYDKVRAMTKHSGNIWYWVSWNLNTNSYIGFLSGDMPSDAATNGPKNWIWASCAWVGLKENYPIYPGESFYFVNVSGMTGGDLGFQGKHTESR